MNDRIEAIYENGVFRPLGEVSLPDQLKVVLWIENAESPVADDDPEVIAEQQRVIAQLQAELALIPHSSHTDGLTCVDHDKILYGRQT